MTEDALYCKNHPDRETGLLCNRCGEPICTSCATHTPTGYRCPQCIKEQSAKFNTAEIQDYVIAFFTAAILSFIGGFIARFLWFYFVFLLAPGAGIAIAEAVRRLVQGRRSKRLYQVTTAGVVVGALPFLLPVLLLMLLGGGVQALFGLLTPILYVGLAAPTAYTRLSGIRIG